MTAFNREEQAARRARRGRVKELTASIEAHGFKVVYQTWCECADTPGFPGQIRGVTDRAKKLVRISVKANPGVDDIVEILEHELHHLEDPSWDCGNRDVLGRGGPSPAA